MVTTVSEFVSAAVSDRGLNEARPQNEDSFLELPEYGLFAVADGVGGAQAGEVASQMAVEILGEAFANQAPDADPEETMRVALERANEAIYQMSQDIPQLSSMATTVVAVHISGDMATIAHVGDSRVYRADGRGYLFRETEDHSVVEEEVRAGRMTPEQALNHPSRNVISRALGAEETVDPDIKCVLIHPGSTFLLCSDGITRHIDDSEIETLLNSEYGPEDICARMKEVCFSRGAEDNLTAVVLRFPGDVKLAGVAPEDDQDIEEVTVAGARLPVDVEADTDENIQIPAGVIPQYEPTEPQLTQAQTIADPEDESYLLQEAEPQPDDEPQPTVNDLVSPSSVHEPPHRIVRPILESYEPEYPRMRGGFERAVTGVGLLLAGIVVGVAAGYFLFVSDGPDMSDVPVIPIQQSENVSLTSFEKTRRLVDEDPVRYLNARAATPMEADDFFWLGRALLLTGKPVEAKRQFEEARLRLDTFDDRASARTMAHEIAMALAIVDDPQALDAFSRAATANSSGGNANSNGAFNAVGPAR